jgi:hypothetical protein
MHVISHILAIGLSQWCRHRRSLVVAVVSLLMTSVVSLIVGPQVNSEFRPWIVVACSVQLVIVYALAMNPLLLVDEVGNFSSGYVKAMFTLPVPSSTLVFCPMAYGAIVMAVLWVSTAVLVYWPLGFHLPLVVPALACAAGMAWLQTLSWLPWEKGFLRDLVTMVLLVPLVGLPVWLLVTFENAQHWIGFLFVGYLVVAFALGHAGVVSSRQGNAWPFWPALNSSVARPSQAKSRRAQPPFRSVSHAQFWYEWRCHGLLYPCYLGMVYSFIVGLMIWRSALPGVFLFGWVLLLILGLPIMMAGAIGPTLGLPKPFWIKGNSATMFLATRPVSSGGLVIPKYQMGFASVLLSWLIVAVGTAFWIVVSGNVENARSLARIWLTHFPGWKGMAVAACAVVLLPTITWRQISDFFALALTGRKAVVDGCVIGGLIIFMGFAGIGAWLYHHPRVLERVLPLAPYLAGGLLLVKGAIATSALCWTLRLGLLNGKQAGVVVGIWLIMSAVAISVVALSMPEGVVPVSMTVLCIAIASIMPLARIPVAVVAMEWNRHR